MLFLPPRNSFSQSPLPSPILSLCFYSLAILPISLSLWLQRVNITVSLLFVEPRSKADIQCNWLRSETRSSFLGLDRKYSKFGITVLCCFCFEIRLQHPHCTPNKKAKRPAVSDLRLVIQSLLRVPCASLIYFESCHFCQTTISAYNLEYSLNRCCIPGKYVLNFPRRLVHHSIVTVRYLIGADSGSSAVWSAHSRGSCVTVRYLIVADSGSSAVWSAHSRGSCVRMPLSDEFYCSRFPVTLETLAWSDFQYPHPLL
jgi:hypothetical protein